MKEDLLAYYEAELRFIREGFKEFGADHPALAQRLMMEGDRCDDPHVERLIQGFALIAGRIRLKLDEQFPEITESLLGMMTPHYLCPIPSLAIAQLAVDPRQGRSAGKRLVPQGSQLFTRSIVNYPVSCQFRTVYETTIWPLQITGAKLLPATALDGTFVDDRVLAVVRVIFECQGEATASSMKLDCLRFHIHGEGELPYTLHELLDNNTIATFVRSPSDQDRVEQHRLPDAALRAVGFELDEALLPSSGPSFAGYRLLTDYFSLPEKFLFFDLGGFQTLPLEKLGRTFEVDFVLGDRERKGADAYIQKRLRKIGLLRKDNIQLGCTPVVNLFKKTAEPIAITHTDKEYRISLDSRNPLALEIFSVDTVTSAPVYGGNLREYQPFYAFRHHYDGSSPKAFWISSRRASQRKADPGTDVFLSLVDTEFHPANPATDVLTIRATCTNRDLPATLPLSHQFGELLWEDSAGLKARFLTTPTEAVRPPLRSSLQWRLISHLALNYLSLADNSGAALREILQLYNYAENESHRKQISGLLSVKSHQKITRLLTPVGVAFPLGLEIEVEFDEDHFVGNGVYLLAAVLERFLALYGSVNSFTQMVAKTRQRTEVLREWPPRAGRQILV